MIKYWASPSWAATLAILQLCPVANEIKISVEEFVKFLNLEFKEKTNGNLK